MILEFEDRNILEYSTSTNPQESERTRHDIIERSFSDFLIFKEVKCNVALVSEEVVDGEFAPSIHAPEANIWKRLPVLIRQDIWSEFTKIWK